MKLSLFLLGVLVSIGLTSAQSQSQYGRGGSCFCTANYQPFCGTDEVTYSNKCELECAQRSNPSLRTKFEGVCAVPYVPENSSGGVQKSGNYARPTTRPYVPPIRTTPRSYVPPIRTTPRAPYVPLPSPRPTYNQYPSQNQGYVPLPSPRPTYNQYPSQNQGYVPLPSPRPSINRFPSQNQGYVPLPSPRPNNSPSWAPQYGQGFSGDY